MKTLPRKFYLHSALVLTAFCLSIPAAAASFDDPLGRFSIDLPAHWKLLPKTHDDIYAFGDGAGQAFVVGVSEQVTDAEVLLAQALAAVDTVISERKTVTEVADTPVNGNVARSGLYKGTRNADRVDLFVFAGGVVLRKGGIYAFSFSKEAGRAAWEKQSAGLFGSLRDVGAPTTSTAASAQPAPPQDTAASEELRTTLFEHPLASVHLLPGWRSDAIPPDFDKEAFAVLKSAAGASAALF